MVTEVGFEFRDLSSTPTVCMITDDGLRQVVYLPYEYNSIDGGLLLYKQQAIEEVTINILYI